VRGVDLKQMKKKRVKYKPDCEFWFVPRNGAIVIDNPHNRATFKEFLKSEDGKWIKAEFRKKNKPKSKEVLGFYWGGLLSLYVLHNKGIKWEDEPEFVKEQYEEGNITKEEVDEAHYSFMLDLRPIMTTDLRTSKPIKQRGEMSKMKQKEMMIYVADVCDWFIDNIGFLSDCEKYKKGRDMVEAGRLAQKEIIKNYSTDYNSAEGTAFD